MYLFQIFYIVQTFYILQRRVCYFSLFPVLTLTSDTYLLNRPTTIWQFCRTTNSNLKKKKLCLITMSYFPLEKTSTIADTYILVTIVQNLLSLT